MRVKESEGVNNVNYSPYFWLHIRRRGGEFVSKVKSHTHTSEKEEEKTKGDRTM